VNIEINTNELGSPNWSARGRERIVQNVKNLISLTRYEVAFDRTLGLTADIVDRPALQAESLLAAEIAALLKRSEPRAKLASVTCTERTADGILNFKVVISVD